MEKRETSQVYKLDLETLINKNDFNKKKTEEFSSQLDFSNSDQEQKASFGVIEQMDSRGQEISCNNYENSKKSKSDGCDEIEPWPVFSPGSEHDYSQPSALNMSQRSLAPFDPAKLAKKIKDILNFANIHISLFANEVMGISRSALENMLNPQKDRPLKQWAEFTIEMKRRHHIMHEWSQSPEKSIEHLKAISIKDDNDENIDPVMLLKKVSELLKDAKVSQELFGKEVLGISKHKIFNMLQRPPKPWIQFTDRMKQRFKKMHKWMQSPAESVSSLKALTLFKVKALSNITQESDYVEDEELLDTLELAYKANKLLKNFKISKAEFGQMLDIHLGAIRPLFETPAPWHLLTKLKKDYYRKIHKWLVENKGVEGDLHNSTSEEEGDEEMDTFKVSREIVQLLKTHAISHNFFASKTLLISSVYFSELVTNTKPWTNLHKSQKKIFKIIKKWTLAKSEEIKALEQKYQVYRARRAINSHNFRKEKALYQ
jgi:hypothetical protein